MKKILVIVGPTASGKSELAVELASSFNGEVISADSRQIYKELNIGTGKITQKEMRGITHHLLDVINVGESFSVVDFKKKAELVIEDILNRGKLPILVGGTGMYIQAVVDNITYPEVPANQKLREDLEKKSTLELLDMLKELDLDRAKTVDQENPRRIIRAIEIAQTLGSVPKKEKNPKYESLQIGLEVPRDELRERISHRTKKRLKKGWIDEVKQLHNNGQSWKNICAVGLGYRCIAQILEQHSNILQNVGVFKAKAELELCINASEWQYAKRQMNWFKRDKRIHWLTPNKLAQAHILTKIFLA